MTQGFDVAILEYTIAAGPATRDRALADALAAWRLIKAQVPTLGLHGGRFGVMGYSAGGHLGARLTSYLAESEQPDDLMLIYPAYLNDGAGQCAWRRSDRRPCRRDDFLSPLRPTTTPAAYRVAANTQPSGGKPAASATGNPQGRRAWLRNEQEFARRCEAMAATARRIPGALPAVRPQSNPAAAAVSQKWVDRHRQKCAAVAREKFDLILIGDSITHNFERPEYQGVWNQFFRCAR